MTYGEKCCFLFKQKTAYEMRSSDWSSDVCSSDLAMIASMKASYARGEQALQTAKKLQAEARAAIEATRASARKAFEQDAGNTRFLATFGRALGGADRKSVV